MVTGDKVSAEMLGKLSDTDSEPPSPLALKSKSKRSGNSSPKSLSSPYMTGSPIKNLEIKLN